MDVQRISDLARGDRPLVDQVGGVRKEARGDIIAELDYGQVENISVHGVTPRIAGVSDLAKASGGATKPLGGDNQLAPIKGLQDVPAGQAVWLSTIKD